MEKPGHESERNRGRERRGVEREKHAKFPLSLSSLSSLSRSFRRVDRSAAAAAATTSVPTTFFLLSFLSPSPLPPLSRPPAAEILSPGFARGDYSFLLGYRVRGDFSAGVLACPAIPEWTGRRSEAMSIVLSGSYYRGWFDKIGEIKTFLCEY